MRRFCCLVLLLCPLVSPAASAENAPVSTLSILAQTREWLALLHYPRSGGKSYVVDAGFFLSPEGAADPLAELQASVAGLAENPRLRCQFPARYRFAYRHGLMAEEGLAHCGDYLAWREKLDVNRLVLVLAASYLNSPSSMYGHSFLRLDPRGARAESPFLSFALNFGARIPAGENGMLYAYRGIFGGYPGFFSLQPYYEKIQEYTRLENRDMWEYELKLEDDEIETLLSHSWELNGVRFGYYFFDQNCAYRLLELLEVARPELDLTSGFDYAAMPVDTIRRVVDAGLIGEVTFRASRRSEFDVLVAGLGRSERRQVAVLAVGELAPDGELLSAFTQQRQQQILMAAYRLLRYRYNKRGDREVARRSLALLSAAQSLGKTTLPRVERPGRPDQGHPTSRLSVAAGELNGQAFGDVEGRISYHDAIDSAPGYPEGASLEMGQLRLRWWARDGVKLQQLVPVHIRSLSPWDEYFRPLSWQVRGIAERLPGGDRPLITAVHGGLGASWALLGGSAFVLPSLRVEYNPAADRNWQPGIGTVAGLLWQGEHTSAELSSTYYTFDTAAPRQQYQFAINRQLSVRQGLRLEWQHQRSTGEEFNEIRLAWRGYF